MHTLTKSVSIIPLSPMIGKKNISILHRTNQGKFFWFGQGFYKTFADQCGRSGLAGFVVNHFKRPTGARVTGTLSFRVHFETPLKVFRDPCIKRIVPAFQHIKIPFFFFFLSPAFLPASAYTEAP